MEAIVRRSEVYGTVRAPSSKSYTHRSIVCGLLANGTTRIHDALLCDDTLASIGASQMLGAEIRNNGYLEIVSDGEVHAPIEPIDCGGSGTTIRLFTAISALSPDKITLTGDRSLCQRPMSELVISLRRLGAEVFSSNINGNPPVVVRGGRMNGTDISLRGDISSQYFSALLFVTPRAASSSRIISTTRIESKPYLELTVDFLEHCGISIDWNRDSNRIVIEGNQQYYPSTFVIPGDYSSAAFLIAAGILTGELRISNLKKESVQGDSKFLQILASMGYCIQQTSKDVTVESTKGSGLEVNVCDTPDITPILAVVASQAKGRTIIRGIERLRYKESNRIETTVKELSKMNVDITIDDDCIIVNGPTNLTGAIIDPHDDHRIAMACAIAGLVASGPTLIKNIDCISKSYPNYVQDLKSVGAEIKLNKTRRKD